MSDWCYLSFSLTLKNEPEELLPAFIKGSINNSLTTVFGEIGGQIDFDLLSFDEVERKGILRVPINSVAKTRAALSLISQFQEIPAVFRVHQVSPLLSSATALFIKV